MKRSSIMATALAFLCVTNAFGTNLSEWIKDNRGNIICSAVGLGIGTYLGYFWNQNLDQEIATVNQRAATMLGADAQSQTLSGRFARRSAKVKDRIIAKHIVIAVGFFTGIGGLAFLLRCYAGNRGTYIPEDC